MFASLLLQHKLAAPMHTLQGFGKGLPALSEVGWPL